MNGRVITLFDGMVKYHYRFLAHHRQKIPVGTPLAGTLNTRGEKNLRCSTEIDIYQYHGNGAREIADGYYGSLKSVIGGRSIRVGPNDLQ